MKQGDPFYFLPGLIAQGLIIAAIFSLGLSWILLVRYRSAVKRLMSAAVPAVDQPARALPLAVGNLVAPRARSRHFGLQELKKERRRFLRYNLLAYGMAGLAGAALLTRGPLDDIDPPWSFWRVALVACLHLAPLALIAPFITGASRAGRWKPVAAAVLVTFLLYVWRLQGDTAARLTTTATLLAITWLPAPWHSPSSSRAGFVRWDRW